MNLTIEKARSCLVQSDSGGCGIATRESQFAFYSHLHSYSILASHLPSGEGKVSSEVGHMQGLDRCGIPLVQLGFRNNGRLSLGRL